MEANDDFMIPTYSRNSLMQQFTITEHFLRCGRYENKMAKNPLIAQWPTSTPNIYVFMHEVYSEFGRFGQ